MITSWILVDQTHAFLLIPFCLIYIYSEKSLFLNFSRYFIKRILCLHNLLRLEFSLDTIFLSVTQTLRIPGIHFEGLYNSPVWKYTSLLINWPARRHSPRVCAFAIWHCCHHYCTCLAYMCKSPPWVEVEMGGEAFDNLTWKVVPDQFPK